MNITGFLGEGKNSATNILDARSWLILVFDGQEFGNFGVTSYLTLVFPSAYEFTMTTQTVDGAISVIFTEDLLIKLNAAGSLPTRQAVNRQMTAG